MFRLAQCQQHPQQHLAPGQDYIGSGDGEVAILQSLARASIGGMGKMMAVFQNFLDA